MELRVEQLEKEAVILSPIFKLWYDLVVEKRLQEYDFAGLYVLAYLSQRRPRKWSAGFFDSPLTLKDYDSVKLRDTPHIIELLTVRYLQKLFGESYEDRSIVSIFASVKFTGIKKNAYNFVNQSIVYWALQQRPFCLMTSIPTPLQVLRMQARGSRVVTTFLLEEELSTYHMAKLHYMEGNQNHSKDAFEFFVHDLKHMENFVDPATYLEQTGFFHSVLGLGSPNSSPKNFLKSLIFDQLISMVSNCVHFEFLDLLSLISALFQPWYRQLWNELEYLISDMNCYLPHLFKYFVAKLTLNIQKIFPQIVELIAIQIPESVEDLVLPSCHCLLRGIWIRLLESLDISENNEIENYSFNAAMSMVNQSIEHSPPSIHDSTCSQKIRLNCICERCSVWKEIHLSIQEEGEILRTHFREIAVNVGVTVP